MSYKLDIKESAQEDLARLKKSEISAFKKATKLLDELQEHPATGTGKPEQLKYYQEPTWSRRISDKHRLVYRIQDEIVTVLVISAYGHYEDK
ncbi:MAG: Txe/YoeB family addiction module toxin [Prevotellaceae bacterium]|jgi:toxin YoeB|nr:Txe/YoeB family addiction module toxin [Prevotellaceae bacterium]